MRITRFVAPQLFRSKLRFVSLLLLALGTLGILHQGNFSAQPAFATDPVEDLQKQIDELANMKKLSESATTPLQGQLTDLEKKVTSARNGIASAKKQAVELAASIEQREQDLGVQYEILAMRIAQDYKRERASSPFLIFLSRAEAAVLTKELVYRDSIQTKDNQLIQETSSTITQLQTDKTKLEGDQITLANLEKQLDDQADFFRVEIDKARKYQQELSGKIANITAQQQSIINARSGTYTTAVGDVPLADDFNASIGYKASAPSNSFAVFSFGAYTHRNGMSQYGAKGRADAGQSVEDILRAYYPNATLKKDYAVSDTIEVQGTGRISFEGQYLQGIYEMPGGWHVNALKAQAIAARTYAVRYTNNGQKSICTTEACQVFKNSKKGGEWEKAVNETKGWVLVDSGGSPVSTQYASTHGAYSNTGGWDTTDGNGGGDWSTKSWEKHANSPWFYKAWYRQAYSSSSANCGRAHPWLSQEEMADIINAWIVRKSPGGADVGRIQPVTINQCNVGGGGGNPYSMEELRNFANSAGGAVTSISSLQVSHTSNALTSTVKFQTNRGEISISGSEFKSTFNLRAPGYISIPQSSFAFFNIEHKQ
ncbi:MAG: hypothetical protein M3Q81_02260 [bacterium]|nr:hypothetical protein [bacterium]